MMKKGSAAFRRVLFCATSSVAAIAASAPALAEATAERPASAEDRPEIVIRDGFSPNAPPPGGIWDTDNNITGIGQVVRDAGGGSVGTCTGTLINPRTVIFAAHCVNTAAASSYGGNTGGTGVMVGFQQNTLAGIRQWLGLDGGQRFATNTALATYNVEHIWYDPRSLAPGSDGFLQADIAIATLDTPAFNIPTWAMLFSPLTQQEHVAIVGYGGTGTHSSVMTAGTTAAGNWRRRAAENMVSLLGSMQERNAWLFGANSPSTLSALPQNLYMISFSDPNPGYNTAIRKFDFGIFGPDDVAQPREGTTAPGDSGGPLILDRKFDIPLVLGVLSGGSRFFAAQPFSTYGTHAFYQPLYAFWDVIVANNPYVYATNKGGDGSWTDPGHWVQTMDPNYFITVGDQLVNGLPDTPAIGVGAGGTKFGQVCFLASCTTLVSDPQQGDGTAIFIPGGPGSTGFVPNNVSANPGQGIKPRYYDVTLSAPGTTTLADATIVIDRLTVDGQTKLDIRSSGSLRALGDYTQDRGWVNVDGTLQTGDALILSGLLSGSGTFKAPFLTVVGGIVAPGGSGFGTLTVDGNMVMSSASSLFIDANRGGSDKLAVGGQLFLSGGSIVFNNAGGAAPRHGQSFTIVTAGGGIDGTFGSIYSFQGVLRPELTYGTNDIVAFMRAGSLANQIGQSGPVERAFALALDTLRDGSYNALYNLYGAIDLMDSARLSATLRGLAPSIATESLSLQDRQSKVMLGAVTDRLSSLGTGESGSLSIVGTPQLAAAMASHGPTAGAAFAGRGVSQGLLPSGAAIAGLPKGMTGFISGGYSMGASAVGDGKASMHGGQHSLHFGMGLEIEVASDLTFGTAVGHAQGFSAPGLEGRTDARLSQVAAYGAYRLGGGAYLAGLAAAETSRAGLERSATTGEIAFDLYGATSSRRYLAMAEAGVNLPSMRGLAVTPRASIGYASHHIGGFREAGGELALQVDDLRLERLEGRLGFKAGGSMKVAGRWSLVPQLQADVVTLLSGAHDGMTVRFAEAADHAFLLPLAGGDRRWGEIKGGLKLTNGPMSFGAGLESSIGRTDYTDERAVVDFTLRF